RTRTPICERRPPACRGSSSRPRGGDGRASLPGLGAAPARRPPMSHFKDFEFDLPSALLERLVLLFSEMTPGALNDETVEGVPEAQGVYQLFFQDELVYVGKTDADAGLKRRLLRHARKIRARSNLTPESVTFKAVRVYVFT